MHPFQPGGLFYLQQKIKFTETPKEWQMEGVQLQRLQGKEIEISIASILIIVSLGVS